MLATSRTERLITLVVLGAPVRYVLSLAGLFVLRRREPELAQSSRTPDYPVVPVLALGLAAPCLAATLGFTRA